MSEWTQPDRRIGMFSAIAMVTIIAVYISTGLIGVLARPPHSSTLQQVDPYLAILECLILLAAVTLVVMMAAVYAYAPPDRKAYALAALAFMIIFATLTCSVHFAALTVVRRIDPKLTSDLFRQLSFEASPTLALAVELLAWDFFFGLSMLFASRVFSGSRLENSLRTSMTLCGTLCVLGTLGPVTGEMRISWLGIMGYAFVLPIACVFLAILFARSGKVL